MVGGNGIPNSMINDFIPTTQYDYANKLFQEKKYIESKDDI